MISSTSEFFHWVLGFVSGVAALFVFAIWVSLRGDR